MLFLTEANEKYIDELERFKKEVLICDRDNKDQFAGCMGLRDCSNVKEWIDICNLRKSAETCEQAGTPVPSTTYFAYRESDNKLVGVDRLASSHRSSDSRDMGRSLRIFRKTIRARKRLRKGDARIKYSKCQKNEDTKTSCGV